MFLMLVMVRLITKQDTALQSHSRRANNSTGISGVIFKPKYVNKPWRALASKNGRAYETLCSTQDEAISMRDTFSFALYGNQAIFIRNPPQFVVMAKKVFDKMKEANAFSEDFLNREDLIPIN